MKHFNAFISYSHQADDIFAEALQSALQKFAKPWYKKRNLEIFRDESSLTASPHLWKNITEALDASDYLILLASHLSEKSKWVDKEVKYWLEHKSIDTILIALTEGEMKWDEHNNCFQNPDNNSLPPTLDDKFHDEPFYIDLRKSKTEEDLSLNNPIFKKEILKLAAELHNKSPNDLASEEVSEHRRMIRIRNGAIAMLLILFLAAIGLMIYAFGQQAIAVEKTKIANEQTKIAKEQARIARDSSDSARRQRQIARDSSLAAMEQRNIAVKEKDNAVRQTKIANEQRKIAETRSLVVQSKALEEADPTRALRLLEQAHYLKPSPEISYEVARLFYNLSQRQAFLMTSEIVPNHTGRSAVSLDGSLIASWTENGNDAFVWSRDGELQATLVNREPLSAVRFLPCSHSLLTVSASVKIWSADGTLKSELPFDRAPFDMVSLPDAKGIALGFDEKLIFLDHNGQPYKEIPLPRFMHKLRISKDGNRIVTWSRNYHLGQLAEAYLINSNGQRLGSLIHKNSIDRSWILRNGRVLTWGGDSFVRIWDGMAKLILEIGDLAEVAVSADGRQVALFWKSGQLGFLDIATLHIAKKSNLKLVRGATFSEDSSRLVVWFQDSSVMLLDGKGKVLSQFNHGKAPIVNVRVSSAGRRILTWDERVVRVWNNQGDQLGEMAHDHRIDAANFLNEGDQIISWEGVGPGGLVEDGVFKARLWEADGKLIGEMYHQAMIRGVNQHSEDGSILTWAHDGIVKLWRKVSYIKRVDLPVRVFPDGALFSDDDKRILVWFENGLVKLLNARGQLIREVKHSGPVAGAQFVGDRFRSWTSRGEVFIWDHLKELIRVSRPQGSNGISFATNANRFITWSLQQAIIWDGPGKVIEELSVKDIRGAVITPDGGKAVIWDSKGDAILWSESEDIVVKISHDIRGISKVHFSSDAKIILFHTYAPGNVEHPVTLRRWDGGIIADLAHVDDPLRAMFVPNQQKLLTWWGGKAPAKLWGFDGKLISALTHGEKVGVNNLRVSSTGRTFVTWVPGKYNYSPAEVKIWDRRGFVVATLPHPTSIDEASIDSKDSYIFTRTHANWIRIYNIMGKLVGEVNHGDDISGAKFLNNSESLMVWGSGVVRILNYNGESIMEVKNLPSRILTISNNENTAVTSSYNGLELILTPKGILQWLETTDFYRLSIEEMRTFGITEPTDRGNKWPK
ncbi:TIR domain-containing protein [Poritiphilus flavus]|uniref:TIR domain-containing protein n=1 Tax=Poritiphilus flavus TaxID=2697053 RepID=A0A6L9E7I6_9FLAO|nr:TIR domain-containing protein [Poritiphilus flavus]NAS10601.1 TIR domain-containing protein [Poritiphilus flavus]